MNIIKIIKKVLGIFGIAFAIFMVINILIMFLGIQLNSDDSLNNTRLLFAVCFMVSIPIGIKYIK